jgi:hypothetical protein
MTWAQPLVVPDAANSASILIRSPHTVTFNNARIIDQTVIEAGATLNQTANMTIDDGAGDDLIVNGTLERNGGNLTLNAGAIMMVNGEYVRNGGGSVTINGALSFGDGSYYRHNIGGNTVPTATWHPNSNCIITGNGAPNGMEGQAFGHVAFMRSHNAGTTLNQSFDCAGNFSYSNTGNDQFTVGTNGDRTINVGGDFTISAGTFRMRGGTAAGTTTINVAGNFIQSGGDFRMKGPQGSGITLLNISGNFIKTGGDFEQRRGGSGDALASVVTVEGNFSHTSGNYDMCSQNSQSTILNVKGNFSITGGELTESGAGNNPSASGTINFTGTSPQTYTSGGTVSQTINFNITDGATLLLPSGNTIGGAGALAIPAGGTLTGAGTVAINTANNGSISPGNSIGTLSITGDLAFSPTASLEIEVRGIPGKANDLLAVTGSVAFAGTLNVLYTGGTTNDGDFFDVVTFGSSTGAFTTINYPPAPGTWSASYNANELRISYAGTALPIELLFFQAERKGQTALLSWRTASEKDNDYMAVERSADGRQWEELGQVNGAGTTTLPQDYSFTDEKPLPGLNYYRLKQLDFDGTFEYHRVAVLDFRSDKLPEARVFPNPAHERLTVVLPEASPRASELLLFDAQGRLLRRWLVPANEIQGEFGLEDLAPGMYFLRIAGLEGAVRVVVKG